MTGASAQITEGHLPPGRAAQVLELAEAARAADDVAPLSEHVLLHVRHGSGEQARDLVLTSDGSVAGYAHLDAPAEDGET